MTYINWDEPFTFNGALYPTYANWGGANYSSGDFGQVPTDDYNALNPSNPYLTPQQLQIADPTGYALDPLDYLYYKHDVALTLATTPEQEAQANLDLLSGLVAVQPQTFDKFGEASLYAGATTLAMVGLLADSGELNLLSPTQLSTALTDEERGATDRSGYVLRA